MNSDYFKTINVTNRWLNNPYFRSV